MISSSQSLLVRYPEADKLIPWDNDPTLYDNVKYPSFLEDVVVLLSVLIAPPLWTLERLR